MDESTFLGTIIGSAVGDSIGELAFFCRDTETLLQAIKDAERLIYTDDTAMALGLGESLLSCTGRIDTEHLGRTFHKNFLREPQRGYGPGPPVIFSLVDTTGEPYIDVASRLYGGSGSFGNGAAMRIAPLGVYFYDADDSILFEAARSSAIVTHAHPLGVDGAVALAKAIAMVALKDLDGQEDSGDRILFLLESIYDFVQTEEFKRQIDWIKELLSRNASLEIAADKLGTGITALESVPFSIFAFLKNPSSFETCLLETVMIEGDKDTIGAMVGALLGARLGVEKIPVKWRKKLENQQKLEKLARELWTLKNAST
ncbi:MAG: ADP-ribosylglycohydrolase family protein [Candidatus Odinarchaeota archaeon]